MTLTSQSARDISRQLFFDNGGKIHYIHLDGFGSQYTASPADELQWKRELIDIYRKRLTEETNATVLAGIAENLRYHGAEGMKEMLVQRYVVGPIEVKIAAAYACWKGLEEEVGAMLLTDLWKKADAHNRKEIRSHLNFMRSSRSVQEWVIQALSGNDREMFDEVVDLLQIWKALNVSSFKGAARISQLKSMSRDDERFPNIIAETIKAIRKG